MKHFLRYVLIVVALGTSQLAFAQPENAEIITIDEKQYYVHTVEKGHTLYSISKLYKTEIGVIVDANPEVKEGLKVDQKLKVPVKGSTSKVVEKETNELPKLQQGEKLHKVEKGQTLYAISKLYKVKQEAILARNTKLKEEGLKADDTIVIPAAKGKKNLDGLQVIQLDDSMKLQMQGSDSLADSLQTVHKEMYNAALLLPFYLDMNDSLHRNRKIGEEEHIYSRSLVAIEFMQGAMLALDSVKKLGMSANLHVYETDNSPEQVKVIMGKPELKEADIIIGPLFRTNFELMSEFAKEQKINIVSPVPQSNKVLLGNEYVSKVYPSSITQVQQLAKYVAVRHKTHNIVIVDSKSKHDQAILNAFTNKLNKILYQNDTARYINPVQIGYISSKNILPHVDGDTVNAFVIPSTNQVFVTNIVTKLNGLQRRNNIMLYGMDEWQGFTSIDYEYFNNLQVHLVTPNYIDYDTVKTQQYISLFRNKYGTDPGKYGMLGFDVTLYYLLALKEYGTGFRKKLEEMKYQGVCTSFGFFKAGIENGYENQSVYIVKYSDFNLLLAE